MAELYAKAQEAARYVEQVPGASDVLVEQAMYSANPLSCAAFVTGIPFEIRVRAIRSRLFTI